MITYKYYKILNEQGDSDYKDQMAKIHQREAASISKFKHHDNTVINNDHNNQENSVYERNRKFQNRDTRHTGLSTHELKLASDKEKLDRERDTEKSRRYIMKILADRKTKTSDDHDMWKDMHNRKNKRNPHESIH
jgi:cytochrome P450